MEWDVEYTDEFEQWWATLTEAEQVDVAATVTFCYKAKAHSYRSHIVLGLIIQSIHHMRELRTQHQGRPYRTLYAFDPRRSAILLLGGDKTGDNDWYDKNIPSR